MVVRSELETTLHRLANRIECELADIVRELFIEGRAEDVCDLAYAAGRFIEVCREVRDGKGGDE